MSQHSRLLFTLAASILALASCGGGGEQSSSASTSDSSSSATSEKRKEMGYEKAPGSYDFPAYTLFSEAEKNALPDLGEHEIVAFCPVSTAYSKVYNWGRGTSTGTEFPTWPGASLTEKYNAKWWKVSYSDIDEVNIIFNDGGGKQTRDMAITHPGYWWYWESDGDIHDDVPESYFVDTAKFLDGNSMLIVANDDISSFELYEGDTKLLSGNPGYNAMNIYLGEHDVDILKTYTIKAHVGDLELIKEIAMYGLYGSDEFNANYAYTGDDLGVTYNVSSSTFKVWSPVSSEIKLNIYDTGTPLSLGGSDTPSATYEMTKGEKGVWSVTVNGNLHGKYYTYAVTNDDYKAKEIVDPYARSAGVNGLRGMILDMSLTNPDGWDAVSSNPYDRKELVVYESHIADLTSSSTWNGDEAGRRKYAGFHQDGTSYTKNGVTVKTGFDHIKELGVNAVQILPMFDQDNNELVEKFNWGYNPLNYNVPEGLYSSDPTDGLVRVKEMKEMIAAYNKVGINIIMDVVYNHVSSAIGSNFDVLFPGYFYRYQDNGALSNGSGCGNETASDHYMFRKFMIDSTKYWASEYKLGGFRFDLMGLHDIVTMNQLAAAVKQINPNIVIYGEPWTGGTSTLSDDLLAKQKNGNQFVGYGQFNDGIRDGMLKGGMNSSSALGWATDFVGPHNSESSQIVNGIKGTTVSDGSIADPDKTVNYATCHDNYTLHDRIAINYDEAEYGREIKAMAILCESIVMLSQGTSFMLSGDEFLRDKTLPSGDFDHNSYESSYAVNELDWNLKIEHKDHFEHMQKLIALKKGVDGLHLGKEASANMNVQLLGSNKNLIVYEIRDNANNKTYKIAHQAPFEAGWGEEDYLIIPDATPVDFSGYSSVYLDTLDSGLALSSSVKLGLGQTIVAVK